MTRDSPTKSKSHKWKFPARFRAGKLGWNGSPLACNRVAAAVSEINKVQKKDPLLAADGAVRLIEKIYPAFQYVDTSSGALGGTMNKALDTLIPIIAAARPDDGVRRKWLDRIWVAVENDGIGYLDELMGRWGEICASKEEASEWADKLLEWVREHWATKPPQGYFKGTTICLSSLLAAERYEELLTLLQSAPNRWWSSHKFGFHALAAMGRTDEAMAYAENNSRGDEQYFVDRAVEELLLAQGQHERAYKQYGMRTNSRNTGIATYRAVAKKYPMYEGIQILEDLIASSPSSEGKWFATARRLGFLELALTIAVRSPCDPKTLNRAARDTLEENPIFALKVSMASLHWLCQGTGYEINSREIINAYRYAIDAARVLDLVGKATEEIKQMVENDRTPGQSVKETIGGYGSAN